MTYYLLKVEPCWLVKFSSVFASSHPVCFNFCCETTIFSRFFPTRESGPELKWSSVLGKSNLLQSKNWVYQKRQKKSFNFFQSVLLNRKDWKFPMKWTAVAAATPSTSSSYANTTPPSSIPTYLQVPTCVRVYLRNVYFTYGERVREGVDENNVILLPCVCFGSRVCVCVRERRKQWECDIRVWS